MPQEVKEKSEEIFVLDEGSDTEDEPLNTTSSLAERKKQVLLSHQALLKDLEVTDGNHKYGCLWKYVLPTEVSIPSDL